MTVIAEFLSYHSRKPGMLILAVVLFSSLIQAQPYTKEDYINTYKELAIKEMRRSGIPASITLAQGMLESDNGNSRLATRANNHFGIKCHGWTGRKIYHDDDARHECFRKYRSASESYDDHTEFLMHSPRYSFLFELDPSDYKGWARGLKKAGYATSPTYSTMLIRIIEENNLHQYDMAGTDRTRRRAGKHSGKPEFTISAGHQIYERNRIDYIVVKNGDTFESLEKEMNLLPNELYKYNELPKQAGLYPGQVLYLQPKRNKAAVGNDFHVVQEGESMYSISQLYGIKLMKLYRKNNMEPGEEPEPGQTIWLRKNKP
jgi:LysM repeat protein